MDVIQSAEARVLDTKLEFIQVELQRQSRTLEAISTSIATLARVEQAQVHIEGRLKEGTQKLAAHEARLLTIETQLPGLIDIRKWVIMGILSGVGMMGAAVLKLVFLP